MQSQHRAWRAMVTAVVGVVVAMAGAPAGHAAAQNPAPAAAALVERALESRAKGDPAAPVIVFEVADFQCPYCAQFALGVGKELDRRYVQRGRVQWVFVNFPLHTHRLAFPAAKAALCAGAAGAGFWPMHDRLFEEQRRWSAMDDPGPWFTRVATQLGADEETYRRCVVEDRVAPLILQDFGSSVNAGITGTPTFLIMRGEELVQRLVGIHPLEEWRRILDAALSGS
jgi:protein-disulfide isomerase